MNYKENCKTYLNLKTQAKINSKNKVKNQMARYIENLLR